MIRKLASARKNIIRLAIRLHLISEAYGIQLIKRLQLMAEIENAQSLIAETTILGLPFYYEPYRTTLNELLGPSGLNKMLEQDNYRLSLLEGKQAPLILDIGSHIGIFPRVIKHLFPRAKIYSLEPDRNNFRVLQLNNNLIEDAISFQYGVHEKHMNLRLVASDINSWRSTLMINPNFFRPEQVGSDSFSYDSYDVECVPIDHFVKSQALTNIDMIGITVPGEMAISILQGSLTSIQNFQPIISISLYDSEVETVNSYMHSIGYSLVGPPVGSMHVFVCQV